MNKITLEHLVVILSALKMYRREVLWHGTEYDQKLSLETMKIIKQLIEKERE